MPLSVTALRYAEPCDLDLLQELEERAGAKFADYLDTSGWRASTGVWRASHPGFLLVVGQPVVGFAHVLEIGGHFHLEEISVDPTVGGRGLGRALLWGACGVAMERGADELTLTTFSEIPWNGPWYAREGFGVVSLPERPWLAESVAAERRAGLWALSPRQLMSRPLADTPAPVPAVSVIPVRDGPHGLEVFTQHRVSTMDFAAGAVVFPGGRVDPDDRVVGATYPPTLLREHAARWRHVPFVARADDPTVAAGTLIATGVREVLEETGLRLAPDELVPWDSWTTPIGPPKRFDVSFFVAHVPATRPDQPRHQTTEAHRSDWEVLERLIDDVEQQRVHMLPPTRGICAELAELGSVAAVVTRLPELRPITHDVMPSRRPRPSVSR